MVASATKMPPDCDAISSCFLKRLWGQQEYRPCTKKLSKVRRNLFGFCDRQPIDGRALADEFRHRAEKASQEWNFDFVKEVPLPGRYAWQRVSSCDVPAWCSAMTRPALKESLDDSSSSDHLSENETRNLFESLKEVDQKSSSKKPRLVQTSMKDFTRVQKRRSSRRLKLKQVQLYTYRLRNHPLAMHGRGVITTC